MASSLRFLPIVVLAVLAVGCARAHALPASTALPQVSAAAHPATSAAAPAPRSVIRSLAPAAKLTSACGMLSAAELRQLLGSSTSMTRLTSREDKPEHSDVQDTYICGYGADGNYPFALAVSGTFSPADWTPREGTDAVVKGRTGVRTMTGIGESAAFYTGDHGALILTAAKRSFGEVRSLVLVMPATVPESIFERAGRLVLSRM